ncbi:MAG: hypothetical protein JXA64_11530 [Candidatus Fermentibacteraceae bacterium]|nr:hypothetical protein [Candidatus Fermentibacteraceae bacterium]MBN2609733.1 hypothetical protein [Candidatus Fermentibacteraceae bacterium]
MRRTILVIAAGFLLLLVLEAGIYNWRLILAMRYRDLAEQSRQLSWRRDELLVERAALLSPERLQTVGMELGLSPVPLQRVSVFSPHGPSTGGEACVCMER